MSRKFLSQTIAKTSTFGTQTLEERRDASTFAASERECIDTMLRSVYNQRTYHPGYLRTQDGKPMNRQMYSSDDRYKPSKLQPTDSANIAAYFLKNPGEKLQIFVPDYDAEKGRPMQNSGSIRYLSLNNETGLYEISDEKVKDADPNFLKEAQKNYSETYRYNENISASYSPADNLSNDTKQFVADMNRYRHNSDFAKEYEKKAEEKRLEEERIEKEKQAELEKKEKERQERIKSGAESEHDPTMTRKEYEDFIARRNEEIDKAVAQARKEREAKEAAEKAAEEERKVRQAAEEKKRAEKAKKEEEKRAEKAKKEAEKRAKEAEEQKKKNEEREKEIKAREEAEKKQRKAAEEEQAKKDFAEKQDNEQLLKTTPKIFPAGYMYTTNPQGKDDLIAHNYEDRSSMLKAMKQSVYGFGQNKMNDMIMTADGKPIKYLWKETKIVKSDEGIAESTLTAEDTIQAYFDKYPLGKLQMYWPEDNSMHYLSFDRDSFTYNVSKDPVPAPTDAKEREAYERMMNNLKDQCKSGHVEQKLAGRRSVRNVLSDTKGQERIMQERSVVNADLDNKMSKNWFDALKTRPEVRKNAKSSEREFIQSCDDKTEHGRTRLYEYAISEIFRMVKEPIMGDNIRYVKALREATPALIENMKRDKYEPGFASFEDIKNVMTNVKTLADASSLIISSLEDAKGSAAIDKLCQLAYVDSVRQAKVTSSPAEVKAALSPKSVKAGVKAMSTTMKTLIKNEGGIDRFMGVLKNMNRDAQASTITQKFAAVLNGKQTTKTKTTEVQKSSGPMV